MSDYFEYGIQNDQQPEIPPSSFVRPLNLSDPHRRRSAATSRHSHTSHGSGLTYVTIPREGEQHPPEPIFGMPTPVLSLSAPLADDEEPPHSDYMMVDADPEYQGDEENGIQLQGGRKGFVGGFVSGLRRLPRVMLRNKAQLRRGSTEETVDALPRYHPFSQTRLDPLSVPIVQSMDMQTQPTISVTSPSIRASRDPDQTLAQYSNRQQSHPNTYDGETTLIHQSQINIGSPVDAEPLPGSDYDKMSSVLQATPSVSIASHINHIQKFINDVNQLPWVSSRITADYIPEKNGRRGKGKKQTPKVTTTWYPPQKNELDLLSNGTPEGSNPIVAQRIEGMHRRALTDSATSPSGASRTIDSPSTNLSSPRYSVTSEPLPAGSNLRHIRSSRHHQRRSHHYHHQHTQFQSQPQSQPAIYPYIASPQPLYVYGSPPSPPNLPQSGSLSGSPGKNQSPSAMPVYMISMPPPVYQPMPMYPYPQQAASPPVPS